MVYTGVQMVIIKKNQIITIKHIYVYRRGFTRDSSPNPTYFERHRHEEVNIDLYLKTKGTCILPPLKRRVLP